MTTTTAAATGSADDNNNNDSSTSSWTMSCVAIMPTVLNPGEPVAAVLICLAALCALVNAVVIVIYIVKRNDRLVKATSRELSAIILTGWLSHFIVIELQLHLLLL